MRTSLLLIALFVLLIVSALSAGELEKKTMSGISGFYVQVEVDAGNSSLRLRSAEVQNDIEKALRKSHIPVFQEGQLAGESPWDAATIHVSIEARADTSRIDKRGSCLFAHYILDVRQDARLERDTTVMVPTTTWRVSGFAFCTSSNSASQVREVITGAAQKLISDFREINPRE
jgi:hypothetical protein